MDIDLTDKLREKMKSYPRTRGRYNSSELYYITKGYTTPEEWFNSPEKDMKQITDMWNGIGAHNQIQELLGKQFCEKKAELVYKDIILVAKGDFFPPALPDEVWELKSSDKLMKIAKPGHIYQAKIYCSMFNKKTGTVFQPIQNKDGVYLKDLGSVERDDKWFESQLELLYQFHLQVEKLWEAKNK